MVDEAYNVRNEEWYKYDCKEVRYLFECRGKNGGIFDGFNCFKPYEVNMRDFHLLDGWHKELKCKTSSPEDYAALSANENRVVVSVGRGVASKVIRCNNKGKWVTDLGDDEIEIEDAFCFVIPRDDLSGDTEVNDDTAY
ncbi:hypothetical protein TELCIR_07044 [Teladorsagia circumcincta]|uniref:Uncharacterized protein n=1 Tax=Teladorsagia circumcincta TaxID=45464 RepID=A0A2G9ULC9_TELCI|nr:hypothetical protein TELCIR_07044 [Teladorsagia circumcincta]